mgnify:FL=1
MSLPNKSSSSSRMKSVNFLEDKIMSRGTGRSYSPGSPSKSRSSSNSSRSKSPRRRLTPTGMPAQLPPMYPKSNYTGVRMPTRSEPPKRLPPNGPRLPTPLGPRPSMESPFKINNLPSKMPPRPGFSNLNNIDIDNTVGDSIDNTVSESIDNTIN